MPTNEVISAHSIFFEISSSPSISERAVVGLLVQPAKKIVSLVVPNLNNQSSFTYVLV